MDFSNLTDEQVTEWSENIKTQIDNLSEFITHIKEVIAEGAGGNSIIEVTKSDDPSLSSLWSNFATSMDAANQKLNSQKEVFYSSIQTFVDLVKQSNETFISEVDDTSVSFDDAANDLEGL